MSRRLLGLALALTACGGATGPAPLASAPTSASPAPSSAPASPQPSASSASAPAIHAGHARSPVTTQAEAIASFQSAWTEEIVPETVERKHPDVAQFSSSVLDSKKLHAKLGPCRVAHHRVDDTLGGSERTNLVFFSAIGALDRDGDCWEIEIPTGAFNEILGYVDPGSGALLFAWLVPEG
jgi:hypothetical protein